MEPDPTPTQAAERVGEGPALVLAPHPDDEVLGCAGAILAHLAAGERVAVAVATDGGLGAPGAERAAYVAGRERESLAAAEVLGYGRPEFWRLPDGTLRLCEPLVARVAEALERAEPALLYLPWPGELHPDHRALALAGAEAVRRCARPVRLAYYEVSSPLRPNLLLDLTFALGRKRQAMRCFASQLARQPYDEHIEALNRFRAYTLPRPVAAAEAYRVVGQEELRGAVRAGQGLGGLARAEAGAGPLVSVVVRTLGRPTLQAAVDSVAAQTHGRVELVLVDAKGTGAPPVEAGGLAVRAVGAGRPLGRAEAANLGLEAARGDHLALLDDDDWLYPDHLAGLLALLADARLGRAAYASVEGVELEGGAARRVRLFAEPFDPLRLLYENFIPVHAMLFERSLWEEGCRFDPALPLYEDWDFWLQLSARTPIRHLARASAAYRLPGASPLYSGAGAGQEGQALEAIYAKWCPRWSPAQAAGLARALHDQRLPAIAALRAEQEQAAAERERLSAELEAARARAQQAEARGQAAEAERAAQAERGRQALQALQAELEQRTAYLEGVLTSRSWRWTGPLRATLTRVRGR